MREMAADSPEVDLHYLLDNAGWLKGLARELLGDEHLAEDMLQETWLASLSGQPGARHRNLQTWRSIGGVE